MSLEPTMKNRMTIGILWVLRGLMAALFLFASFMKLTGQPMMVHEFQIVGLGQWFRYFTATLELAGGITILIPRISAFGAATLLCVDIGAFFAQILVLHMDFIHTLVIGAILGTVIYLQRAQILGPNPTLASCQA